MGNNKITICSGESRTINLAVVDSSGTPVDITGAVLKLTVKKDDTLSDTNSLIQVTGSIVNGTAGTATFSLTTTSTNKPAGIYKYDIKVKRTSGAVDTVVYPDDFEIITSITSTI